MYIKTTMKKLLTLFSYCVMLSSFAFAQKLEVTYQEVTNVNIDEFKNSAKVEVNGSSSTIPKEVYDNMIKSMQEPKEYLLKIYDNETNYKKVEKIDNQQTNGMKISVSFGGSGNDLYKNMTTKEYSRSVNLMNKSYVIKDQLTNYNWILSRETKKFNGFDVKKATATVDSTKIITAWYAPSIAVKDGPGMYNGLPGLILELEIKDSKNKSIESIKINAIEVKEVPTMKPFDQPKEKNVISEKEYKDLLKKQSEHFKQMSSQGINKKD